MPASFPTSSFAEFSPNSLFAAGEPGVWFDPSEVADLKWRRNLLTYTEQFDNAVWTKTNLNVSANAVAAPDGTISADLIIETTANGQHRIEQGYINGNPKVRHEHSIYVKRAAGNRAFQVEIQDGLANAEQWTFDLESGLFKRTYANGFGFSPSIQALANGWYKITMGSGVANAGTSLRFILLMASDYASASNGYTGDGTSGFYIWGAQTEQGSTATEYQRISDVHTEVREYYPRATLYQDTAATQPVTTPGQTVGLMLDKSRGLTLGSELVTNGTLDTGITGWTKNDGTTDPLSYDAVGKRLIITNDLAYFGSCKQTLIGLTTGRTYRVTANISQNTVNVRAQISLLDGATSREISPGGGTAIFVFVATTTSHTLVLQNNQNTLGGVSYWDNISVRELPGFHATQPTAASRPIYSVIPQTGRRNQLTYTEEFDNVAWLKDTASIVANSAIAPNGTITADSLIEDTTNNTHQVRSSSMMTIASGESYMCSVYAKRGQGSRNLTLRHQATPTNFQGATFDLLTGTITNVGAGISASAVGVGDGWWRCSIAFVANGTGTNFFINLTENTQSQIGYQGDGTSSILVWGAQVEFGSTATAYQRVVSQYDVTEAGVATLHYLSFDGTDDFMVTPTITPGADKVQVFAGVRKLNGLGGLVAELSPNASSNNGAFYITPSNTNEPGPSVFVVKGSVSQNFVVTSDTASPQTFVLTGIGDISGDLVQLRQNGALIGSDTDDNGTGNFGNYPLYIGRRGGSSLPFNGHLYGLIVRFGVNLPTAQITQTERMLSRRTGFSAPQIDGTPTIGVTPL